MSDDVVTPETLAERVARGVAFLEMTMPDWREHIDVSTLDMGSTDLCVLGQLAPRWPGLTDTGYVNYTDVKYTLRWDANNVRAHGFERAVVQDGADGWIAGYAEDYGDLTAEWRRVLTGTGARPVL